LGARHYSLRVAWHSDMTHLSGNYDWWDRALTFEVVPGRAVHSIGVLVLDVDCRMQPLASEEAARWDGSRLRKEPAATQGSRALRGLTLARRFRGPAPRAARRSGYRRAETAHRTR